MFRRFKLHASIQDLAEWAMVPLGSFISSFDNAPKRSHHPVLRLQPPSGLCELKEMQAGLVPSYARDDRGAEDRTEVHAETISCSSNFRTTFRRRRCLVPATQMCEHGHVSLGAIHDCSFAPNSNRIISIAALWESWTDNANHEIHTFAIITGLVAPVLRPLFDRLPIVIAAEDRDTWLHSSVNDPLPLELLKPLSAVELRDWSMMPYDDNNPPLVIDQI
jgi:putative SOS response-associated peptidase YedK